MHRSDGIWNTGDARSNQSEHGVLVSVRVNELDSVLFQESHESDDDAETAMLVWMWGTGHAAYKAGLRPTYNSENIKRFEQTVVRAAP